MPALGDDTFAPITADQVGYGPGFTVDTSDVFGREVAKSIPRPGTPVNTQAPTTPSRPSDPRGTDWSQLMQQMEAWMKGNSSANAMRDQAAAARRAAIQQLAVKYGGLPQGFTDKFGDYDAATQALAEQNQFSDVKLLARRYAESKNQLARQLAARRALSSGETDYGYGQLDTSRAQNEYDLGNDFLGRINQELAMYGDRMNQAYGIEEQAAAAARMQALQLAALGGGLSGAMDPNAPWASSGYVYDPDAAGLQVREPYDYVRGSDIRYFTPNYGANSQGWIPDGSGWIAPDGTRLDEEGRVR